MNFEDIEVQVFRVTMRITKIKIVIAKMQHWSLYLLVVDVALVGESITKQFVSITHTHNFLILLYHLYSLFLTAIFLPSFSYILNFSCTNFLFFLTLLFFCNLSMVYGRTHLFLILNIFLIINCRHLIILSLKIVKLFLKFEYPFKVMDEIMM